MDFHEDDVLMPIARRFFSIAETADYLGSHKKTVYAWVARGLLPSIKIGGSIRIDLKRLEEGFERQLTKKGPAR